MTNNRRTSEIMAELACQHERCEAINAFLEDLCEAYSVYGIGRDSNELQSANSKLITLTNFLERELNDMNKTMEELRELNRPYPSMDVKAVREVVEMFDKVLEEDGPFFIKTGTGSESVDEEVTRERILEFYIEWALERLYESIGEEEQ